MTTVAQIREWLDRAEKVDTHMLVVCDTFDYTDYPVFVSNNIDEVIEDYSDNMSKVMEVYNLNMSIEDQLNSGIAFNK